MTFIRKEGFQAIERLIYKTMTTGNVYWKAKPLEVQTCAPIQGVRICPNLICLNVKNTLLISRTFDIPYIYYHYYGNHWKFTPKSKWAETKFSKFVLFFDCKTNPEWKPKIIYFQHFYCRTNLRNCGKTYAKFTLTIQ